jgi:sugar phosphate isomerase/epimerase
MRAISLAALTVLEVSPVDAARIASRCGYSHIGLRAVAATPDEKHFPILTDRPMQRELLAALDGEGIGVLDIEIIRILPEMDWSLIEEALTFAQQFAATRMLVADNDPVSERSAASLAQMAELAAPYGVMPHLEFMPWTCAPNLSAAQYRIEDIANCALLIDAFHLVRSGGQVAELHPCDPGIGYLQLCDIAGPNPAMDEILREARADRLFPGEGDIDLKQLLRRLPDVPVSLEIPADRLRDAGWSAEMRAHRAIETTLVLLEQCSEDAGM